MSFHTSRHCNLFHGRVYLRSNFTALNWVADDGRMPFVPKVWLGRHSTQVCHLSGLNFGLVVSKLELGVVSR